jgi:hypothetical protein
MGELRPSSKANEGNDAQIHEGEEKDLDAGARFVLKSKGTY